MSRPAQTLDELHARIVATRAAAQAGPERRFRHALRGEEARTGESAGPVPTAVRWVQEEALTRMDAIQAGIERLDAAHPPPLPAPAPRRSLPRPPRLPRLCGIRGRSTSRTCSRMPGCSTARPGGGAPRWGAPTSP